MELLMLIGVLALAVVAYFGGALRRREKVRQRGKGHERHRSCHILGNFPRGWPAGSSDHQRA